MWVFGVWSLGLGVLEFGVWDLILVYIMFFFSLGFWFFLY